MGRARRTTVVLTSVAIAVLGAGGLVDVFTAEHAVAAELPAFDSCPALQSWVDRAAADEARHPNVYAAGSNAAVAAPGAGASGTAGAAVPLTARESATTAAKTQDAVGSSATGTNVQEAGVDEPDRVKTDGRYIVGVGYDRTMWIATVNGHTPHVISRLQLDGDATSLMLAGHRALVLVQPRIAYAVDGVPENEAAGPARGPGISSAPGSGFAPEPVSMSQLEVVELSDPANPHVIARQTVTGSILSARQVGDVAWVVTQTQPRAIAKPGEATPLLPQRKVINSNGAVVSDGDALPCTAVRHPTTLSGSELLTVQPVTITADAPFLHGRSAGVIATGGYVYASAKRLYVATTAWANWSQSNASTQIHAFDISNATSAAYIGSGSVRGTLLSQWAMSEQDGFLRVASTTGAVVPAPGEGAIPLPGKQSETGITVLAEKGSKLVHVGHVGGLGRGERVWAVRYLGDLAAVVTFRQTDPLYLVDLSQPTAPRVRGALELTGYSSYLHPVGNGLLLGIGREADLQGHVLDAKATLFDVSDVAHPKRVGSISLGDSWSEVDGDTHAFTYLPDRHVALLPTSDMGVGARSISVDGKTLRLAGELSSATPVDRFLPVGPEVVASSEGRLLDVDPIALDVLGQTQLS